MAACPACGTEVAPPAVECPRCHLSVGLFEAVREAVGVEESDPRYSAEVHELLRAVDGSPTAAAPVIQGPAVPSYPLRFPAAGAPAAPALPEEPTPPSLDGLPALPALPSGGTAGLRKQIDDYLRIGRSMGLDLTDVTERDREALAADDRPTLERTGRELFVRLAAAVAEEYESTIARRNGLAGLVGTAPEDAELTAIRAQLLAGDLAASEARLGLVRDRLTALEDEHATVLILIAEGELLASTIRELGGDPGPALGPLEEGRRLVLESQRAAGEAMLARASVALWAVLYPRLGPELRRLKDALVRQQAAGVDVRAAVQQLRDLAANLKNRNFAATIGSYRRLRDLVAAMPAAAAEPSPPAAIPPPSASPS